MGSPVEEWRNLVEQAASCRNCDLWRNATQTVFAQCPVPAIMTGFFDFHRRQLAPLLAA